MIASYFTMDNVFRRES